MESKSPKQVNGADLSVEAPGMTSMSPKQVNGTFDPKQLTLTCIPRISVWADICDEEEAGGVPLANGSNGVVQSGNVATNIGDDKETPIDASFAGGASLPLVAGSNPLAAEFSPANLVLKQSKDIAWLLEVIEYQKQHLAYLSGQIIALSTNNGSSHAGAPPLRETGINTDDQGGAEPVAKESVAGSICSGGVAKEIRMAEDSSVCLAGYEKRLSYLENEFDELAATSLLAADSDVIEAKVSEASDRIDVAVAAACESIENLAKEQCSNTPKADSDKEALADVVQQCINKTIPLFLAEFAPHILEQCGTMIEERAQGLMQVAAKKEEPTAQIVTTPTPTDDAARIANDVGPAAPLLRAKFDTYAVIGGLSRADLNGKLGYILEKQERNRWAVLVLSLGKQISINEKNLNVLSPAQIGNLQFTLAEEKCIYEAKSAFLRAHKEDFWQATGMKDIGEMFQQAVAREDNGEREDKDDSVVYDEYFKRLSSSSASLT